MSAATQQRSDRVRMIDRFGELIDYAFAWLEPHEASLILHSAASDLKLRIEREERDTLILRALREAQASLPDGPALDKVEKAIEQLTDEGCV